MTYDPSPILKAILFDLDGVVAETEDLHRQAYNLAFEEAGLDLRWSEQDYRDRLAKTAGSKLEELAPPPGEVDPIAFQSRLYERKRRHYLELLRFARLPPRPGVVRLIEEALQQGVQVAAASTCAKEGAVAILEHTLGTDLSSRFSTLRAGEDVANRKPAPDIYLAALADIGLDARDCVAIEDTLHGLQAAKGAGLWTLITPSQYTRGDEFPGADEIVESLESPPVTALYLEERLRRTRNAAKD